ncbi:terminase large subunit [Microbacterium phage Zooman]|nr:terminase large subunit [Microbacterium phage Zooman]
MQTLKQQIEALAEPQRSTRRAFYTDDEWENSWELNALPFQIEPQSDDWKIWTIIAPPKAGKTWAGEYWVKEKFFRDQKDVLCLFSSPQEVQKEAQHFASLTENWSGFKTYFTPEDYIQILYNQFCDRTLVFASVDVLRRGALRGMKPEYLWADEIEDANEVVQNFPFTERFLFTQPTKLHPDTIISRAGDGRTY